MDVGILGYGIYVPQYRIKVSEIASVWGKNSDDVEKSLGNSEKSVAGFDEDAVTLAYESAVAALKHAGVKPEKIDICFVGSESHPYAVNPTSTIVGEFLGFKKNYLAADLEFACKAATAGMISIAGLIESGAVSYGLTIGSDTAQSKPHDVLEYTAAAASAAFVLGRNNNQSIAKLVAFTSFSSDTPDFWRRDGVRFPSHGGRFTGEPAYFYHVEGAARELLSKLKMSPEDFDYCIFHMPNGKFPRQVAKRLGFTPEKIAPSLIVDKIGNPYTASSLLGLSAVLDIAKPNERIFMVSYGSGAGSDAFVFEVTENIIKKEAVKNAVMQSLSNKKYISYPEYLRFTKKI
ncbi:hydroxymethylglutaryl-CoA synthase [Patescibacteria group bacterium]|nr:hydroxymethylglutaryl-CoA synthase [Patescibacteria group bacterium]MCL5798293.1 hydroxymethylglutaryl-CoA synthase [Patescibacteria group bacterium]